MQFRFIIPNGLQVLIYIIIIKAALHAITVMKIWYVVGVRLIAIVLIVYNNSTQNNLVARVMIVIMIYWMYLMENIINEFVVYDHSPLTSNY